MLITLAFHDLDLCARTVKLLAGEGADDLRAALASTLRNRFVALAQKQTPSVLHVCQSLLHEAIGCAVAQPDAMTAFSDVEWCRAMAMNCLVWSGDVADPTNGATSCHRHDMKAPWAARRDATALIGAYIFLR
jgi:hypothetical protein